MSQELEKLKRSVAALKKIMEPKKPKPKPKPKKAAPG